MSQTCPSCGTVSADEVRFCPSCGTAFVASCANCGAPLPPGARFCPSCATPVVAGISSGEERKLVTVLFADVTGSTALGERLDPERLRALLQSYFAGMSAAIETWGGTVEKYIGDAVMAAFGVPHIREDDAERALRAALDMLRRLDGLNREFETQHGVSVAIRIGVNTGEVIAPAGGPVAQLIVAGDAVNVAARLEQTAEPGTVLVGERTYIATRDAFRFGEPVDLELKGKAAAVRGRQLLGERVRAKEELADASAPWRLHAPMVGRDRELRTMDELFTEAVERGRPQLMLLYGPAGIGKSRLIEEFVARAGAGGRPLRILRGRCMAAGQGVTYWACAEILRAACDITLDEPAEAAQAKLIVGLARLLEPLALADEDVRQTMNALAITAGMTMPDNPLERMEPRAVAEELARAWPRFATALATTGPTVLAVEDLHWAGEQMLDMVERLLARSEGPILLVATARPEFAESHPGFLAGRDDVTAISLRPLTEQQSGELVEALLAASQLPDGLREDVLTRAEGNPFFLEEILRRLIDEGVLVHDDGGWRATGTLSPTSLPDTIHGLLAARIDGLPAEEKRVLQEAAVVGRVFWAEPVRRALGNGQVETALLRLEGKGLVTARPTSSIAGQAEFAFRHALVRDVAEAGLPKTRRARSNAVVGAWAEELAAERRDEFIELIAHFYGTAVMGEGADLAWANDAAAREVVRAKAFEAMMRAGDLARQRYALARAVQLHREALDIAADDAERQRAHEAVGDDERAWFHGDEAWAAYALGLGIARQRGDGPALARMASHATYLAALFGVFREFPDPVAVHALIEEALPVADAPTVRSRLLSARSSTSTLWLRTTGSDPIAAEAREADAREAAQLARQVGDAELESLAEEALTEFLDARGDYVAVLETYRRQVSLLDRIESPSRRAMILLNASSAELDLAGDHERGRALALRLYEVAKGLSPHELMHATANLILAAYWSGRWDDIPPLLAEHLEALSSETERACGYMSLGPAIAALVDVARGDVERAEERLALVPMARTQAILGRAAAAEVMVQLGRAGEARDLARQLREEDDRMYWPLLSLLEALVALEEWPALGEALADVRARAAASVRFGPAADRAEGVRLLASGDRVEAERLLRAALEAYERIGMPFEAARTLEHLAEASEGDDATAFLRGALERYERLGAAPHAARVRGAGR